jgi:protease-4
VKKRWIFGGIGAFIVVAVLVFAVVMAVLAVYPLVKPYVPLGKKVGVLEVTGPIDSSKEIIRVIHAYRDDPSIAAVIVYIDSPGGSVTYTQEIYDELVKLKERDKIVTAYMSAIAASGGYYVACTADEIYASPGTLTGSIGVILTVTNIEGLFDKIGLETKVIKSGKYKDIGSPMRDMTPEEEALLGDIIDDVYYQFLDTVVDTRTDAVKEVMAEEGNEDPSRYEIKKYVMGYADGRIFSGRQAKKYGFVDELCNFQTAIDKTAELAGIKGKPTVVKIEVEEPSLWDMIFESSVEDIQTEIGPRDGITLEYSLY